MKILVVSNLYGPESRGGAEIIAKKTAEEMARQGHEVVVLSTTAKKADSVAWSDEGGVRVARYHPDLPYHIMNDANQPMLRRLLWHAKDLLSITGMASKVFAEVLEEFDPELVISHNLRGMEMRLVHKIRTPGVPWIHVLHDVQLLVPSGQYWFENEPVWQREWVTRPYQWLARRLMKSPDIVVGPSQYILDAHADLGFFRKSKLVKLVNPMDWVGSKREKGEGIRLLSVGQLTRSKGIHVLIGALSGIEDIDIRADIVGDGPEAVELMNQAIGMPENISLRFHGKVPHDQVLEYMKKTSAFVLPSVIVDNCPNTVMEANSCGVPTIASNVGGVPELVDETGLFEPGDVQGLVERIRKLAKGGVKQKKDVDILKTAQYVKKLLSLLS